MALLAESEAHLRRLGAVEAEAFPQEERYPFYCVEHAYLSQRMDHVQALMQFSGYRAARGEVYLEWPDCRPPPPGDCPVAGEVSVEWSQGAGARPGFHLRLRDGARQIAVCRNVSCGDFSANPAAQDRFLTTWLGVEEDFQGRGVGRYLLLKALQEGLGAGYRHALISTAWDNYRAFVFYANLGYRVTDWTYGWRRALE